ncbi:hypothetical protein Bca101_033915 [Brassica carinata]
MSRRSIPIKAPALAMFLASQKRITRNRNSDSAGPGDGRFSELTLPGGFRCHGTLEKLEKKYDLVVNIQGDEPLIEPEIIDGVVKALQNAKLFNGSGWYSFVFIDRMVAHAMELWTAVSDEGEVLAHEEQQILGGINMEDLHRLDYAQKASPDAES